jgi:hypothetical protein
VPVASGCGARSFPSELRDALVTRADALVGSVCLSGGGPLMSASLPSPSRHLLRVVTYQSAIPSLPNRFEPKYSVVASQESHGRVSFASVLTAPPRF